MLLQTLTNNWSARERHAHTVFTVCKRMKEIEWEDGSMRVLSGEFPQLETSEPENFQLKTEHEQNSLDFHAVAYVGNKFWSIKRILF